VGLYLRVAFFIITKHLSSFLNVSIFAEVYQPNFLSKTPMRRDDKPSNTGCDREPINRLKVYLPELKQKVGIQVQVYGPNILKELHAGKEEVKDIIIEIGEDLDPEQLRENFEEIGLQTKAETFELKASIGHEYHKTSLEFWKKGRPC
jgi:hypothetical protein